MTFLNHTLLFAEPSPPSPSAIGTLIPLVLAGFVVAGFWKTFEKAGKPGWGAIIPIYNLILLLEIAGKPIWWIILYLIPFVNFIVIILVSIEVAKKIRQRCLIRFRACVTGIYFLSNSGIWKCPV